MLRTPTPMTSPRLLLTLAITLLLAAGASATPITQNADLSGTIHNGENHAGSNGSNSLFLGASFVGTVLSTNGNPSTFLNADFTNANLSGANLRRGDFSGAILTGVTFSATTALRDVNFTGAVFDGVTLIASTVRDSNFSGASFLGADLSGANLWAQATWTGVIYDAATILPAGMDPAAEGMTLLVAEPQAATLLGLGLLGLALFGGPGFGRRD